MPFLDRNTQFQPPSLRKIGFVFAAHQRSVILGIVLVLLLTATLVMAQRSATIVSAVVRIKWPASSLSGATSSSVSEEIARRILAGSSRTATGLKVQSKREFSFVTFATPERIEAWSALAKLSAVDAAPVSELPRGEDLDAALKKNASDLALVSDRISAEQRTLQDYASAVTLAARTESLTSQLGKAEVDLARHLPKELPKRASSGERPFATGKAFLITGRDRIVDEKSRLQLKVSSNNPLLLSLQQRLDATNQVITAVDKRQAMRDRTLALLRRTVLHLHANLQKAREDQKGGNLLTRRITKLRERERALYDQGNMLHSHERALVDPRQFTFSVDRITIHKSRLSRKIAIMFVIGFFAAVLVACLTVIAKEFALKGFRSSRQAESVLGRRISAEVPELIYDSMSQDVARSRDWPIDYLVTAAGTPFALAFRQIIESLGIRHGVMNGRTLAVSSALPNEGKTTVSICLARSAALSGLRVVLIDGDGRRSMLSRAFPALDKPGLVQVLNDNVPLIDALENDARSGAVLLRHSSDDRVEDLSIPGRLHGLLEALIPHHDLVIVDSAPVLALAEARITAASCNDALLVVRWRVTPRRAALQALQLLVRARANVSATVLTRVAHV